ncbi:hypothetical protein CBR_g86796, partial [Chara braunii]
MASPSPAQDSIAQAKDDELLTTGNAPGHVQASHDTDAADKELTAGNAPGQVRASQGAVAADEITAGNGDTAAAVDEKSTTTSNGDAVGMATNAVVYPVDDQTGLRRRAFRSIVASTIEGQPNNSQTTPIPDAGGRGPGDEDDPYRVLERPGPKQSYTWQQLRGFDDWSTPGMLDLDDDWTDPKTSDVRYGPLKGMLIKYGELAQLTYDATTFDSTSRYCGQCVIGPENIFNLLCARPEDFLDSLVSPTFGDGTSPDEDTDPAPPSSLPAQVTGTGMPALQDQAKLGRRSRWSYRRRYSDVRYLFATSREDTPFRLFRL